jgi:hypothetical protein
MADNVLPSNEYEESILAQHSTPGLKRNKLTRASKKLNLEFDEHYSGMTRQERDDLLDRIFPESVIT